MEIKRLILYLAIALGGLTPGPSPKERGDNEGQIKFWKEGQWQVVF